MLIRSPSRRQTVSRQSDDEALSNQYREDYETPSPQAGPGKTTFSNPCARSVPKPIYREQVSFPNPLRMKAEIQSHLDFGLPIANEAVLFRSILDFGVKLMTPESQTKGNSFKFEVRHQ